MPAMIFQAVGYYHVPGKPCARRVIASFKTEIDAQTFCDRNNDAIQATELEMQETTCVDNYGFPVTRAEYAELFPNFLVD